MRYQGIVGELSEIVVSYRISADAHYSGRSSAGKQSAWTVCRNFRYEYQFTASNNGHTASTDTIRYNLRIADIYR
jgi:hypothetical protein